MSAAGTPRRALVTGVGGQLGRELVRTAPAAWECIGLTRVELDVADQFAVEAAVEKHRPDLILNTAAFTAVDRAEAEPDRARATNVLGPAVLATQAARRKLRMIHISTDYVFDGNASLAYRPEDPTNPLGTYGATKLEGERRVQDALPAALIVRTSWLYSESGQNFVTWALSKFGDGEAVRATVDQIGSPTWVGTLAPALWAAARLEISGVVHWADLGVASRFDLALAVAEEGAAAGLIRAGSEVLPATTADFPTPARRPAFSPLDGTSAREALGLAGTHWRLALREALRRRARESDG